MSERIKVGGLTPGVEMDRAVEKAVGLAPVDQWKYCGHFEPSTNITDAFAALEAWQSPVSGAFSIDFDGEQYEVGLEAAQRRVTGYGRSIQLATCDALLRWAVATRPEEFEA